MLWHPNRSEIDGWFDLKLREFAKAENWNPKLSMGHWLDRHIRNGPHEWFFVNYVCSCMNGWKILLSSKQTFREESRHPRPQN